MLAISSNNENHPATTTSLCMVGSEEPELHELSDSSSTTSSGSDVAGGTSPRNDDVSTTSSSDRVSIDSVAPNVQTLVQDAKQLYETVFNADAAENNVVTTVAPGRVNLIGEHTDYTGGFVLPFAIDYSTVVYGTGRIVSSSAESSSTVTVRFQSTMNTKNPTNYEEHTFQDIEQIKPPSRDHVMGSDSWKWYIIGTIAQYVTDEEFFPAHGKNLELTFTIAGDVPLGSGLSSSASLEVAVAKFVECILLENAADVPKDLGITRALKCQKAENKWCYSPCGIMDQFVSSNAQTNALCLIDCQSYELQIVPLNQTTTTAATNNEDDDVVLVIANSNVKHSIANGEYPIRVEQCQEVTSLLQKHAGNKDIQQLRDATLGDLETTKDSITPDDVLYRRAKHVITENSRTLQVRDVLVNSADNKWKVVGQFMNDSHESMSHDYETSCEEINILQTIALSFNKLQPDAVYGSRLTGGGFGGCTVSLVNQQHVEEFMQYLQKEYYQQTKLDCTPFPTTPGPGVRQIIL